MADYMKMWKDLGMDTDKHDVLCEVLPQAFGDVYLSQENRPEAMDYFNFVVSEIHGVRPAELIEAQKKGKKVFGTFCTYVPDEVILAANGIVTGLCGGSQFWVPGGEKVLPVNTCPLIKASVGARLDGTCPFFKIADMYIGETTCDGKKKAYEILAKEVPTYVMDLPQMKREKDLRAWVSEIHDLKDVVEKETGVKVTAENLNKAIKVLNNKRKALTRLYNLRKNKNIPISGADVLLITQIAYYDDPIRLTEKINALCDELDERVKNGVSVFKEGTKRILVTGTPMALPNWKIHNIVETSGGAVVCEENCTGVKYFRNYVDETKTTVEDQISAIADRYMNISCACFTPNDERPEDIIQLCKEYSIDGVIDINLKFCTTYDIEGYTVEKALQEAGIPVLGIETDYTDSDAQQLKTRIGAFMEILED